MTVTSILPALTVLAYMLLMWLLALRLKDNSIVDIGWGMGFVLIVATYLWRTPDPSLVQMLMAALVALWAVRLSGYIYLRNKGKGEDFRYAAWRKEWGHTVVWRSLVQVFMLQGAIMLVVATPIHAVFVAEGTVVGPIQLLGAAVALVGIATEAVADTQMMRFKSIAANKGRIMQSGLWRYSRHPNYFGEAVAWWGLGMLALPTWWALVGPALITFLLLKVSGVAMLERKYTGNAAYDAYIQRTSAFVPWWPKG